MAAKLEASRAGLRPRNQAEVMLQIEIACGQSISCHFCNPGAHYGIGCNLDPLYPHFGIS
jgi:hypothetical protein